MRKVFPHTTVSLGESCENNRVLDQHFSCTKYIAKLRPLEIVPVVQLLASYITSVTLNLMVIVGLKHIIESQIMKSVKGKNWWHLEEEQLCRSYLHIGQFPKVGTMMHKQNYGIERDGQIIIFVILIKEINRVIHFRI
jgi:hypothetical protein